MPCLAQRRVLADARSGRDAAYLDEVIAHEHAICEIEYFSRRSYDWAPVRHAEADIHLWEARCDEAEIALAGCLEELKISLQS